MKNVYFQVLYRTAWGEQLRVRLFFNGNEVPLLPLETADGYTWQGGTFLPESTETVSYLYEVHTADGRLLRRETGAPRTFAPRYRSNIAFCDTWRLNALPPVMQHSAFAECVMAARGGEAMHEAPLDGAALLLLRATPPPRGRRWAVVGSSPALGEWHPQRARFLQRTDTYEWGIALQRDDFTDNIEYKYVWVDERDVTSVVWEEGDNRKLPHPVMNNAMAMVHTDEAPQMGCRPWRGAGVVAPVFSLRSEKSIGCGDFADLADFICWAASVGMQAVQLLPINDTTASGTWRDSYPYNAISVFALHPIYVAPREWADSRAYALIKEEGARLNALDEMDYEATLRLKTTFLRDLFVEKGNEVLNSPSFKAFMREQSGWLKPYARFCRLRDTHHTANFRDWPAENEKQRFAPAAQEEETFHCFVQFLLHRQMETAHKIARQRGVILKGDIPIGVSRDSVEAYSHPSLLHFDGQAGAPPDAFAVNGQNWGFPTYNWEEMAKDDYKWWRERLAHMSCYFDAYRIDHVLGFFRIWEVPTCQIHGVLGRFRPALPYSEEEIHGFGFTRDVPAFSRAGVSGSTLDKLCEELGDDELRRYFDRADDRFVLRPEVATQRAIEACVPEGSLRDVLMKVAGEVLFIADPDTPGAYHPRIAAQLTFAFSELSDIDRAAFNRLHDHFFYVRHNRFWADEAMKKLPAVTQSAPGNRGGMLPCAEDLGMVPASVKGVLEQLEILSLEIQTMPKAFGVRFGRLEDNPYLSVATIATHDMPPLRLWWRQNPEAAQAYWEEVMKRSGKAPEEATPELCEQIVYAHLASPSMLCLLALQDYLAVSPTLRSAFPEREQINVPANPNQYWRYRMHLTIEQLVSATGFNERVRALIEKSGRV